MRKIILVVLPLFIFLASCSKSELNRPPVDESYWLRQDRGVVVASDYSTPYFVLETSRGYSVIRTWGGSAPYSGSVMYGDFTGYGGRSLYNRSEGYISDFDVRDYWLSYYAAMDEWQYLSSSY